MADDANLFTYPSFGERYQSDLEIIYQKYEQTFDGGTVESEEILLSSLTNEEACEPWLKAFLGYLSDVDTQQNIDDPQEIANSRAKQQFDKRDEELISLEPQSEDSNEPQMPGCGSPLNTFISGMKISDVLTSTTIETSPPPESADFFIGENGKPPFMSKGPERISSPKRKSSFTDETTADKTSSLQLHRNHSQNLAQAILNSRNRIANVLFKAVTKPSRSSQRSITLHSSTSSFNNISSRGSFSATTSFLPGKLLREFNSLLTAEMAPESRRGLTLVRQPCYPVVPCVGNKTSRRLSGGESMKGGRVTLIASRKTVKLNPQKSRASIKEIEGEHARSNSVVSLDVPQETCNTALVTHGSSPLNWKSIRPIVSHRMRITDVAFNAVSSKPVYKAFRPVKSPGREQKPVISLMPTPKSVTTGTTPATTSEQLVAASGSVVARDDDEASQDSGFESGGNAESRNRNEWKGAQIHCRPVTAVELNRHIRSGRRSCEDGGNSRKRRLSDSKVSLEVKKMCNVNLMSIRQRVDTRGSIYKGGADNIQHRIQQERKGVSEKEGSVSRQPSGNKEVIRQNIISRKAVKRRSGPEPGDEAFEGVSEGRRGRVVCRQESNEEDRGILIKRLSTEHLRSTKEQVIVSREVRGGEDNERPASFSDTKQSTRNAVNGMDSERQRKRRSSGCQRQTGDVGRKSRTIRAPRDRSPEDVYEHDKISRNSPLFPENILSSTRVQDAKKLRLNYFDGAGLKESNDKGNMSPIRIPRNEKVRATPLNKKARPLLRAKSKSTEEGAPTRRASPSPRDVDDGARVTGRDKGSLPLTKSKVDAPTPERKSRTQPRDSYAVGKLIASDVIRRLEKRSVVPTQNTIHTRRVIDGPRKQTPMRRKQLTPEISGDTWKPVASPHLLSKPLHLGDSVERQKNYVREPERTLRTPGWNSNGSLCRGPRLCSKAICLDCGSYSS
ncbi:predicted protein [Nematostella vectensis]|uniref:Uncharacterized protein n=1 Tax=Nematostella vectensis TaxID=45351 RepID=A7RMG2_NEMVE|nr:predicted protein [Nematostella vectensis]|eukprot:XP_001639400.1 predicted protein [Nematostella vectensis]